MAGMLILIFNFQGRQPNFVFLKTVYSQKKKKKNYDTKQKMVGLTGTSKVFGNCISLWDMPELLSAGLHLIKLINS